MNCSPVLCNNNAVEKPMVFQVSWRISANYSPVLCLVTFQVSTQVLSLVLFQVSSQAIHLECCKVFLQAIHLAHFQLFLQLLHLAMFQVLIQTAHPVLYLAVLLLWDQANTTLWPEFEIIKQLYRINKLHNIKSSFHWVKGHQDMTKNVEDLPI